MNKLIISCFVLGFLILCIPPARATYKKPPTPPTTDELITKYAEQFGSNPKIINAVIRCESGGNHTKIGDGGKANGIAQFWEGTFYRMAKIQGEELHYSSANDQLKLLSFAMANPKLAREWTTYRAIENGGKFTFYYKQQNKYITVYCKI